MSDRNVIVGGLVAFAVLCIVAIWHQQTDIEEGVVDRTAAALDNAGVAYERVRAEGRIAKVVLADRAPLSEAELDAIVVHGFFEPVMRVDLDSQSGPNAASTSTSAPTATTPTSTSPTTVVDPVKPPELRVEIEEGAIASLTARVGSPVDASALVDAIGPPNGWSLAEDPATIKLPLGVIAIVELAADTLTTGSIVYTDGRLDVSGSGPDRDALDALAARLDGADSGFSTSHSLEQDVSSIGDAISEAIDVSGITFATGTAQIEPNARAVLDDVAVILLGDPRLMVTITGHTDSVGDPDANLSLSLARADAVAEYLEAAGVDGADLTSVGSGDTEPVADNATPEGRAENRRIEFTIIRRGVATP